MKIMMPLFSRPLEISELQIPVVVIENQSFFYKLVSDITDQIEGKDGNFIVSDHGESLDLKNTDLIIDVFSLDCNHRKSLSLLHKKLSEISVRDNHYLNLKELQRYINIFLQEISDEFSYPVHFTEELSIQDILKASDMKFNFEDQTFSESLINYLSIMRDFGGKTLFFICNLKTWLTDEEITILYKDILYRKINVVLLENHVVHSDLSCEVYRIIDNDLCEIT